MPLVKSRPLTPGQRFLIRNKAEVAKKRPEKQLTVSKHEKKGRNCYGRITSRRRGAIRLSKMASRMSAPSKKSLASRMLDMLSSIS